MCEYDPEPILETICPACGGYGWVEDGWECGLCYHGIADVMAISNDDLEFIQEEMDAVGAWA